MKRSAELDELNQQVTQAIEEVSRIEEAIVLHTKVDSLI